VYCGQTVGWINTKLGMQVGLGPYHILLDGGPAPPPPKGAELPNFRPISVVAKCLDGSKWRYGGKHPWMFTSSLVYVTCFYATGGVMRAAEGQEVIAVRAAD